MTVGAKRNRKTWYLPKKVLTHCSPFFNAALNGNFAEANSKVVDLPEDDPVAFEIWATWLSLGKCDSLQEYGGNDHSYVRAWVLGDKLVCPAFQDNVMFQFLDWCENCGDYWPDKIDIVYRESSPDSKLRHFFVDWFVWEKLHGWLSAYEDQIIALTELPELLKDVLRAELRANKDTIMDPSKQKHRYYQNPTFEPNA